MAAGACSPRGATARDPGSPTPVAAPAGDPGVSATPRGRPGKGGTGGEASEPVPVRAAQAPEVTIEEALEADTLLGRRVRVTGRCTAAGQGRNAGSWTLEEEGNSIEVRGLVPSSCAASQERTLTIFAQIEPTTGGQRRLLLRLPD